MQNQANTAADSVVFICNSSPEIGFGHALRCRNLAAHIQQASSATEILFFSRQDANSAQSFLDASGFRTQVFGDWDDLVRKMKDVKNLRSIVVDSYEISAEHERRLSPARVLVWDDLFDRQHQCSALLNQNWLPDAEQRYRALTSPGTALFLGPSYCPISLEYLQPSQFSVRPRLQNILVFFGATDPQKETLKLTALAHQMSHLKWDFVVAEACPHRAELATSVEALTNAQLHVQVPSLKPHLEKADLFVGSGGSVTWERLKVGTPGVIASVAANQAEMTETLANEHYQIHLGSSSKVSLPLYEKAIQEMNFEKRKALWERGKNLQISEKIGELIVFLTGKSDAKTPNAMQ